MSTAKKGIIILVFGIIYGFSWGSIYLFFSDMHGMTKMFNDEFLFGVATLLNVEILTKSVGFIYSFSDGFIVGILIGLFLIKISVNKSSKTFTKAIENQK